MMERRNNLVVEGMEFLSERRHAVCQVGGGGQKDGRAIFWSRTHPVKVSPYRYLSIRRGQDHMFNLFNNTPICSKNYLFFFLPEIDKLRENSEIDGTHNMNHNCLFYGI